MAAQLTGTILSGSGVVLQEVAVFDELTVAENIDAFCALYVGDRARRRRLVEAAIAFVDLEKFANFRPKRLSGGLLRDEDRFDADLFRHGRTARQHR